MIQYEFWTSDILNTEMKRKTKQDKENDSMAELRDLYKRNKEQQHALKKLLKALDDKSLKENKGLKEQ